jgi:TonB family protein
LIEYPSSCIPPAPAGAKPERVVVAFDVTDKGLTENVRTQESTNECFNETAVGAVRSWTYEPRKVNGDPKAQESLEVTLLFEFQNETIMRDFDARPIVRVPPQYPELCMRLAKNREEVLVEFDVAQTGVTENYRVVESSYKCLNEAALKSVAQWRYQPKLENGVRTKRSGVQTTLVFELRPSFGSSPETKTRTSVLNAVMRAQRSAERDPQEALSLLAETESKYGSTFTPAELRAFHQVRARARISEKNYRGALDDLRMVQRTGLAGDDADAVGKTMFALEAAIAAEDAARSQEASAPE